MQLSLVLTSLCGNGDKRDSDSIECIHIYDIQSNLIGTIFAPCEYGDEALSLKKMLYQDLEANTQDLDIEDEELKSILFAAVLPSFFLALHYYKGIKSYYSSYSVDFVQIKFKDFNASDRSPLSVFGSGMSVLSIYLFKYCLSYGLKGLWNHFRQFFAIKKLPSCINQDIPLHSLFSDLNLSSPSCSIHSSHLTKEHSSCLVIGDGIRAAHKRLLTDPNFYIQQMSSGISSSYLICTELTPIIYSKNKRVSSPLNKLLIQLNDGMEILEYLLTCINNLRNKIRFFVKKLNIKMIIITDLYPERALTIALAIWVANEMNLKISIISHSIGPILLKSLNQSRNTKSYDLMNNLSYGEASYFVPVECLWDYRSANLDPMCRKITLYCEPRLNVFQSSAKSQSLKSSNNILLISTEFYHFLSTYDYLNRLIFACKSSIVVASKSNNIEEFCVRFRGNSSIFVPLLLQAVFSMNVDSARKIYKSRRSNIISLIHNNIKLKIGFDGQVSSHSLLNAYDSLPHLHVGTSSALMYESMQCKNRVVYLPVEPQDFLADHIFITRQPFVADDVHDAMKYLFV